MDAKFGFLVIDKPAGVTSHDCVSRLRKILRIKRVGHGGTLDPLVTGVLPIAIGKATRLLPYLHTSKKYQGTIQLGERTNTDDLEGETIKSSPWPQLSEADLDKFLDLFRGRIFQEPPLFSSVHINGERAYKKARKGEIFDLPRKEITIYQLKVNSWNQSTGRLDLYIHCSSGTYIRSLARDLGENIGCGGMLFKLRRLEALGFNEDEVIPLPDLNYNKEKLLSKVVDPILSLNHLSKFRLKCEEDFYWRNGRKIITSNSRIEVSKIIEKGELNSYKNFLLVINNDYSIAGIAEWVDDSIIQPKVVLNPL
ncbi:tRNA pseudouridine(55) synthase TruB [Prochlorococcus marinus]|uniref:tRNA pseudouridine synthase B n=1 Tax=Prochlorococcus marinus (strain MIT 9211) TaxID=93059 RepID=A9BBX0_PROM4|nr:tRNA pseudouridine(55) synthase TruB [Prochlorococcus marinus]ABX09332.1 Putative tRNA pseudouridine 55 synthase [Prochlorococcus marinus str. MIT 9211]